jgi:hypothetical protein
MMISDFGFRISDFPPAPTENSTKGWVGAKSEIRNPKFEIE